MREELKALNPGSKLRLEVKHNLPANVARTLDAGLTAPLYAQLGAVETALQRELKR